MRTKNSFTFVEMMRFGLLFLLEQFTELISDLAQ